MRRGVIRLAGIVRGSVVDGPGIRVVVFFQGCPRRCPGCHNPEYLDFAGGEEITVPDLLARIGENVTPLTHGVTLSGGDPFAQPDDLLELCAGIRQMWPGFDVWVYTGYRFDEIAESLVLPFIDVVVDGPFVLAERDLTLPYRGSRNQRIVDVVKRLPSGGVVECRA